MDEIAVRHELPASQSDDDRLIAEIAKDIAKEVSHHIEMMYPKAVEATTPNMLRSVEGCVINEIMAAIKVNDAGAIVARLRRRKKFRRDIKRMAKASAPTVEGE